MPIQKEGKIYHTLHEVSQRLDESIERNARGLLQDLKRARKEFETKEPEYV